MTGRLLEEVRGQLGTSGDRDSLLKAALERAAEREKNGALADAREIWSGIIELYGDDPGAAVFLKEAREGLDKNRDSNPR